MHGRHHRTVKGFAVGQGKVHIVNHKASCNRQEQALHKRRHHQGHRNIHNGLRIGAAVNPGCFQNVLRHAHKSRHINKHHIARVLPHGDNDKAQHGPACGSKPGGGQRADGQGSPQGHESPVKHKFPYVT